MKSNQENDQRWMFRALRLAITGLGRSSPNPSVAACIIKDGMCIGQGAHVQCGSDHAEVLAIKDAQNLGNDLNNSSMYVTLAPCTRSGKTPACSQAIIDAGISRVVAAAADPHQDDPSSLFEQMGIKYQQGCLADAAEFIHGGFLKRINSGLPRITGKWAMTIDGYIAAENGHSQWISSDAALSLSRRRRRIFDAIVIGSGTFVADNPRLQAIGGSNPIPVIIAGSKIPSFKDSRLVETESQIICFHHDTDQERITAARSSGVKLEFFNPAEDLQGIFRKLADIGCNDVLVEGGAQIHHSCLQQQLYDRLEIYIGTQSLAGGHSIAGLSGVERIELGQQWVLEQAPLAIANCVCLRYRSQP